MQRIHRALTEEERKNLQITNIFKARHHRQRMIVVIRPATFDLSLRRANSSRGHRVDDEHAADSTYDGAARG